MYLYLLTPWKKVLSLVSSHIVSKPAKLRWPAGDSDRMSWLQLRYPLQPRACPSLCETSRKVGVVYAYSWFCCDFDAKFSIKEHCATVVWYNLKMPGNSHSVQIEDSWHFANHCAWLLILSVGGANCFT